MTRKDDIPYQFRLLDVALKDIVGIDPVVARFFGDLDAAPDRAVDVGAWRRESLMALSELHPVLLVRTTDTEFHAVAGLALLPAIQALQPKQKYLRALIGYDLTDDAKRQLAMADLIGIPMLFRTRRHHPESLHRIWLQIKESADNPLSGKTDTIFCRATGISPASLGK